MFEIGNTLREARSRRRIDLVEAEQDTKIRSKYLAALEHEDFDVLPGPVFVRGFLRTYAGYLGLDPQTYIDEYNARFGRFEDLDDGIIGARRVGLVGPETERRARGSRAMRTVAVVSLVGLALLAWLGLRADEPASVGPGASTPAAADEDVALETRQGLREDAPATGSAVDAAASAAVPGAAPGAPAAGAPSQGGGQGAAAPVLTVGAVGGTTWMQVQAGSSNGPVVFEGELADGQRRTFDGGRFLVRVGAPSVALLATRDARVRGEGSATTTYLVDGAGITVVPGA